ncbi:MAG: hypothetical protein Kow0069_31080 [Promethearchaeota archaeon]
MLDWSFCPACGEPLAEGAAFCAFCGVDLRRSFPRKRRNKHPWGPWSSLLVPLASLGLVNVTVALLVLLLTLAEGLEFVAALNDPVVLFLSTFLEILFVVPPLLLVKSRTSTSAREALEWLGLPKARRQTGGWKEVLVGVAVGVLMVPLSAGASLLSEAINNEIFGPRIVQRANQYMGGTTTGLFTTSVAELVLLGLAMFLVVGPTEELLFRGFTQQGLQHSWGKVAAVVLTALLFTFAHVVPLLLPWEVVVVYFLPYFAVSLVLGSLMLARKNDVLACILAHGTYNTLLLVVNFALS